MSQECLVSSADPFAMLRRHLPIITHLNNQSKRRATFLLPYLHDETHDVICNIVTNVLRNKIFSQARKTFKCECNLFEDELDLLTRADLPIDIRRKLILQLSPLIFSLLSIGLPQLVKSCRHGATDHK